jgi:hypothetical protein
MATFLSDNFNSYNDGDLNGQGSWDGATDFDVEGTTVKEGTKAFTWIAGANDKALKKVGTARTDGRITWYVKTAATNKRGFFILRQGATDISYLAFTGDFETAGHCYLYDGSWSYDLGAYSTSDWNCCEIEWRSADHFVRARINEGTWTNWAHAITNWTTGIDTFAIDTQNPSGTFFVDTIQEDPYVPPAGTNIQLNVGDTWKTVSAAKVNIGDSWKAVSKAQVNVGDTWKTVF